MHITAHRRSLPLLVLVACAALAKGQTPATPPPKKEVASWSWAFVPSLKEIATMPASATHLVLDGMGDDAAEALQQRRDVRGVLFRNDKGTLTNAGIALLAKLPDLQVLHLEGADALTPEGMRVIGEMRRLEEVGLASWACDAATLGVILSLPDLLGLHLRDVTGLGDDAFIAIAGCSRLRKLSLDQTPGVEAKSLERLAALTQLEVLRLSCLDGLSDETFSTLRDLRKLRWLMLNSDRLTSDGLRALGGMREMRRINLFGDQFDSSALLNLPTTIEDFQLCCPGFDAKAGPTLRDRFPNLQRLHVDRAAWLTDEVTRMILQAPRLNDLFLGLCSEVTVHGFADIAKATSLRRITFEMCDGVTEADADVMRKARNGLEVDVID